MAPKKRQLNIRRVGVDTTVFNSFRGDSTVQGEYTPNRLRTSTGEVGRLYSGEGYDRVGIPTHITNRQDGLHVQDYLFEIRSGESLVPRETGSEVRVTPFGSNRRSLAGQVRDIVRLANTGDNGRGYGPFDTEYSDHQQLAIRSNARSHVPISLRSRFGSAINIFDTLPSKIEISKLTRTSPGEFKGVLRKLAKRFPQAQTVKLKRREFSLENYRK